MTTHTAADLTRAIDALIRAGAPMLDYGVVDRNILAAAVVENARLRAALEAVVDSVDQWRRAQGATSDPGLAVSVDWDAIESARAALIR